ncbi:MAG: hypothetical protein AAFR27_09685, partial [Pseudomonadota bacterium]
MSHLKLRSSVCAAALLAVCSVTIVQAADETIVSASSERDWVGPYLGANIGLGTLDSEGDFQFTSDSYVDLGALDQLGALGGVQLGWNFQRGDILF